jgi:NADPH:quinone reductase-like Zn-dependent oxidoreductase
VKDSPTKPTVAIIGVRGVPGHIAIQIRKKVYNDKNVIEIGRNRERLNALLSPLLDETIALDEEDQELPAMGPLAGVDIGLHYVWGPAT